MRSRLVPSLLWAATVLAQVPAAYRTEVDAWHRDREARLASEDGWLTLVGRDWLKPGENTLGTAPGSTVLLPPGTAPALAGRFILSGTSVRFVPEPGSGLRLNGQPAREAVLASDAEGKPDVLQAGRILFYVIRRGEQVGIRLKDPEHPNRKAFKGVPRYPVDAAWRVVATFTPYERPQHRDIATVLGTTTPMEAPGLLSFTLDGKPVTLEPLVEDPQHPELFIIFRDATAGHGTYPAGRFLYADMPKDGKVVLDFNRAINPPCAFTAFATCPLPPRQNLLAGPIPAGEKDPGLH